VAIPALPGATITSLVPGSLATLATNFQGEEQDPRGDERIHATIPGRLRIGRQARSIVWVRSGPTDTRTIGTPACDSMALT
jgi:hypothetical protein